MADLVKRTLLPGKKFKAIVEGVRTTKVGPCVVKVTPEQAKAFASHWEVQVAAPVEEAPKPTQKPQQQAPQTRPEAAN